MVFWNYDFHTVFRTTEVSTNSLRDFAMSWNYDFHSIFHTAELSTHSLGDVCGVLELWLPNRFPHKPLLASSSAAPATGLAAPPATGPSALSSAVNSSCKDLAWEASCPSGVTGRGKKNLGKKKAAPDDDRRQTTEDARRRRVVFGNVAFDIIQV